MPISRLSVEVTKVMIDNLSQIYFGRVHTKTVTDENDKSQPMRKFTVLLATSSLLSSRVR